MADPENNTIKLVPPPQRSVAEALQEAADFRFQEMTALTSAGFTREEAFDLLKMSVEFQNHLTLHDLHNGGE